MKAVKYRWTTERADSIMAAFRGVTARSGFCRGLVAAAHVQGSGAFCAERVSRCNAGRGGRAVRTLPAVADAPMGVVFDAGESVDAPELLP